MKKDHGEVLRDYQDQLECQHTQICPISLCMIPKADLPYSDDQKQWNLAHPQVK